VKYTNSLLIELYETCKPLYMRIILWLQIAHTGQ